MKKSSSFLIILFFLTGTYFASAQSKQKAELEFLKQLNSILKKSPAQDWAHEGKMSIDSAFAINKAGMLSVTLRYTTDSTFMRVRMVAPVFKIDQVLYDLYLILGYKEPLVNIYESRNNSLLLKESGTNTLFHIGIADAERGEAQQEKLQKALDELLKYYKN